MIAHAPILAHLDFIIAHLLHLHLRLGIIPLFLSMGHPSCMVHNNKYIFSQ